ncbi:uncharacterized protein [Aegilops tauschii subsp. strangulata]|uniref:KIB1-4 beta-propeller domain-containing protein n=1 Tax=Aegilops tauschii TaxID=37682 RepID=M8BBP9_AEGTA|nr:uncharacterized protein LOC109773553 [Aegilops tauschii subsp. strangulata]
MLSPQNNQICFATPQGWIFILHGAAPWETWLWHPVTGETIPLPPIRDDHYIPTNCTCYLTNSFAAYPECAVVLLDVADPDMWFRRINGGSSREWAQHTYDVGEYTLPEGDSDDDCTSTPPTKRVIAGVAAALGGKLHFIFSESNQYKMGVVHLDFGTPAPTAELHTLEDVDAAITLPEGMCSGVTRLLESKGELFQVCVCFRGFDPNDIGAVLVLKMDFDHGRRWRKVRDIGDRVFMLAHGGNAVSCPASACNLQRNRVYFMKNFLEDDGDLCIYDLMEEVLEILVVHERDLTLARTKPYWIVPPTA